LWARKKYIIPIDGEARASFGETTFWNERETSMQHQNEILIRRFIDKVINNGDFDYIEEAVHQNYNYSAPGETRNGRQALKDFLVAYRSAFPDLHLEINDLIASDDKTAVSFTLTGTHRGELMGIAATHKSIEIAGMIMSHFQNGQIIAEKEILDQAALYQQLGLA
jgi:steroid delta-isomerase-like uncharacterized protein